MTDRTKPPKGIDIAPKGYSTETRPRHTAEVDTCEGAYELVVRDSWEVVDTYRREGYMEAARELWDDGQHLSALTLTEDERLATPVRVRVTTTVEVE